MTSKMLAFDQSAREAMRRGVRRLSRVVKVTLGPGGCAVPIEVKSEAPAPAGDGVLVAKEMEFEDPFESLGAQMVRDVAVKTNDDAGDGAATAAVLAEAIFEGCLDHVAAGAYAMALKRGIDMAVDAVLGELQRLSRRVLLEDSHSVRRVGAFASGGDTDTGHMLAEALQKAGINGVVTIEESRSPATYVEWVEGMQFEMGYLSPYFVTDSAEMRVILQDCRLLIHSTKISADTDLMPLLESIAKTGKPLIIIADEIEDEALATLEENKLRGAMNVCAVRIPGAGDGRQDVMEDIAVFTGGKSVNGDLRVESEKADLPMLGRAKRVVVERKNTTILEGAGDAKAIGDRIAKLRLEIEAAGPLADKDRLRGRLAKLAGGVAQIHVGASSTFELKERKLRIRRALNATRAAVEEGILPGGGVAFIQAAKALAHVKTVSDDERTGVEIIRRALEAPIKQIAANCGVEVDDVVAKVRDASDANFGFDAKSLTFGDMLKLGVVDPTKVVRTALRNAAGVAALLLASGALVSGGPAIEAAPGPVAESQGMSE